MRLGFIRFLKLFFSSLFIQSSWSFFSLQAMGFLACLAAGVDKKKRREVIENHKGFFNTHPYMSSYIIGATVRAYDKSEDPADIKKHATIAQQSFASTGDQLFWQALRPSLLTLGVIAGLKFGLIGPVIFFVAYNMIHIFHRAQGLIDGYRVGWDVIYILKSRRFTLVQRVAESLGAICAGLLPWLLTRSLISLLFMPLAIMFIILLIKRIPAVIVILIIMLVTMITLIARL
ncbi:MAG TPA: PTS system mannose/fructose/sorbose family transporter subunit IID [bacterium]